MKKCSWCSDEKKTAEDWLLTELYAHGRMLAFERSFFNADRAERKRRMRWVVELTKDAKKVYTRFIALLEHCLTELVETAGAEA